VARHLRDYRLAWWIGGKTTLAAAYA